MVYCMGSHGRTGTFIASLIALLESKEQTPDPIAAVRERHCSKSVETIGQARAIFALRGEKLPKKYDDELGYKWVVRGKGKKGKGTLRRGDFRYLGAGLPPVRGLIPPLRGGVPPLPGEIPVSGDDRVVARDERTLVISEDEIEGEEEDDLTPRGRDRR